MSALLAWLGMCLRRWLGRVPARQQLTATECGAACLAMVASFYGRDTSVSECRRDLAAGRDGLTMMQLVQAAGRLGMTTQAGTELPERLTGPVIVFWQGRHFVVLEWLGRRGARIVDPSTGRRRLSRPELTAHYSGAWLALRPGPGFTRRSTRVADWPVLRYLREVLAVPGTRRPMLGIVAASAALHGIALAFPLATQYVVDELLPGSRWDLVPLLVAAVVVTAVLHGFTGLVRGRLLVTLRARANAVLSRGFMTHLLRLPLRFFLQRSRGDLMMRLASVASTREMLTGHLLTLLLDAGLLLFFLAGLVLLSPAYLWLTLALGAAQGAVLLTTYRRVRRLSHQEISATAEEQSYLVEALEAVLPLKANGAEPSALERWTVLFERYQEAMVRQGRTSAAVDATLGALRMLAPLALLTLGVVLVLRGEMSVGTMLAANSIATSVLAPLGSFVGAGQSLQMVRAQVERMYDVLDSPAEQSGSRRAARRTPIRVDIVDLHFGYDPLAGPVLRDISLTLPPGRKVGIAGRTGSGKSTLALLVLGLLRPESGQILVDGEPLDHLDLQELRRTCVAVLQNLSLFNGSILDNITLGRPDASRSEVEDAAHVAGLHEDVTGMPMGYQTQVGEGGLAMSAGQRQRIALARALVHRPRLLVLDEATSHLDPATERRVDEALNQLEVTRLVISHRLSAISNAEEILVLDAGRVAERGRHADLLARSGHYTSLFGTTASRPNVHTR